MSQEYDKIMKENIEEVFLPLAEKLLGISPVTMVEIPDELQRTIERKPDFLKRVTDKNGAVYILQIEFQSSNETEMVLRMLEYKSMLMHKYGLPVKQFVIYLGNPKLSMKNDLQQFMPAENEINFSYNLLNIKDFESEKLLESDIPEEIILAILGNYPKKDAVKIIQQIIKRLQQVSKNKIELQRYIRQLSFLSKLRNLQDETIKNIEAMPIHFDIKTDVIYKRGKKEGIQIGEERGQKKGKKEGIQIGEERGKKRGKRAGKKEGIQIGEERGQKKGKRAGKKETLEETISKLIIKKGWSNKEIAETLDVSIKLVKSIRDKISNK